MQKINFKFPNIPVLSGALNIVETLKNAGFTSYFAGGSVRDVIMGRAPSDIDIATSASPDKVLSLFKRTVAVGKAFGVIVVMVGDIHYEIATFRKDGNYVDGRRPENIEFSNAEEDVKRRDFTVNALLFDPLANEIIDYAGGLQDIENKIIRCVGIADERFQEDRLRLLRCIRFAVQLGFHIEKTTFNAVKKYSHTINEISKERISDELSKILTSPNPTEGIRLMDESGLLFQILPEVSALKGVEQPEEYHPEGDVFKHTMKMLSLGEKMSFPLALAILLHDIGKPATQEFLDRIRFNNHEKESSKMVIEICGRLKLPNNLTTRVYDLVLHHMKFKDVKKMRISTLKKFLRMDFFAEHLELHRLDCLSSHGLLDNYYFCQEKIKEFSTELAALKPKILLGGEDLMNLGLKPGPLFRQILTELENMQLENELSTKEQALDWVVKNYL